HVRPVQRVLREVHGMTALALANRFAAVRGAGLRLATAAVVAYNRGPPRTTVRGRLPSWLWTLPLLRPSPMRLLRTECAPGGVLDDQRSRGRGSVGAGHRPAHWGATLQPLVRPPYALHLG